MKNWDLIVATLYWRGSANRILEGAPRRRVWAHGDGYGKMSGAELERLELMFDWSHIRDCSDEGQRQVARAIRTELLELDRKRGREDGHHLAMVEEVVGKLGTMVAA